MPGLPHLTDEKKSPEVEVEGAPQIIIAQTGGNGPKKSNTRKYVIISVSIIIAALIILAAILIGMYMFTEAQKDLIKYTLEFDKNAKQDVTSDPNTNTVKYEIINGVQKTWVVNDFNKDIQVVKIQTATATNCYLSPLNRTRTKDPTQITGPETKEISRASTLTYVTSGTPISDITFLDKDARELCYGISTYWLYPKCNDNSGSAPPPPIPSTILPRTSASPTMLPRTTDSKVMNDNAPWYVAWSYPYNSNTTVYCVTGCCKTVCACSIDYYWYYSGGSLYCVWVSYNCPSHGIQENPISQTCTNGPTGLQCPNHSPATLPDC